MDQPGRHHPAVAARLPGRKGDVILKYSADEARSLKAYGELPESAKINETDTYGHEGVDDNVEFDEDRDSDSDKDVDIDDI